ncbi:MAG TPA: tetratricopeptide repeat protein, partial [Bacilli bacterium]|nr:tetratricopeptide repeat protein [Bacilli bacterium]
PPPAAAAAPPPPAAPAPDVAAPPPAEPPALEVVEVPPMPAWPYAEIYAKASAGDNDDAAPAWEGPASAPEVSASAPPEPATPAAPAPISPAAVSPAEPAPAPVSPAAPPGVVVDSFGAGDAPAAAAEEAAAFARRRGGAPRGQAARMDDARAAGHLSAAGELEAAAKRYCAAAAQAGAVGVYPQALGYAEQALSLLERLPATPERRRLRIRALMETARVHWLAGAPSPSVEGAAFTLPRALELLEQARARTAPEDPAELHAELSTLIADVCYDLGDLRSLERALDELTFASRRLLEAGDATGAARLLNDQAALYVRMGDPVRAAHLLGESRKVFEERADRDPVALLEMAETDHLFARIPLHVPARPGREADALSMGLDHAIAAERTYKRVGAARELARVWETMGRLELRKGRFDRATARLSAALELQQRIGDLVGLARSTAAFSEVLGAVGRHREALMVLSDSVALNLEKGSPIGLAFNRRAFDALAARVSPRGESADVLAKVAAQLDQAEAMLGRMKLTSELS